MKFPLIHTGRRFFFFTFVVEGRMPVLSRLVRGAKRPVLLPAGERIVEVWRDLRHPVLDPALSWSAIGDVTLLASPFLYPVRLSMKRTAEELESEIAEHVERARHGWTPVCGFLSPGEREFERRLKALPFSRWIKAVPYGLPERYDPSVEDSRWLAAHRELILSSFDRSQIEPFRITRPGCLAMNERIADMAARASTSDGGRRPPNPLAPASATGGSGVVATGGSGVSPVVRKEGSR